MWSSITGIVFVKVAQAYPVATAKWFATPGNPQILVGLGSLPLMIWLVKYMIDMTKGNSKDPKKWWKDDDKGQF